MNYFDRFLSERMDLMYNRKLFAFACAAALLVCGGCGSNDSGETVTMDAANSYSDDESSVSTDKDDSSTGSKKTTTKATTTSGKGGSSTTAKSTQTAAGTTTKKGGTTVAPVYQNNSQQNNGNAGAGNSSSGGNSSSDGTAAPKTTTAPAGNQAPAATTAAPVETEPPEEVDATIYITLNGSSAQVSDAAAVSVSGGVITILQGGRYEVSGTLNDGQIVVNAPKTDKINLHFNGAGISCSTSAPLYIISADTCTLHLDSGSTNYVEDTAGNALSACISSKDDLTIKGDGQLTVIGNKKHGIKSSNDVKIKNGTLNISAVATGVYGEDSVQISGGNTVISACKDGIKASNTTEADKGFVTIEAGYVDVQNAAGNGIEAITGITISGGAVNIHSAKKSVNCDYQSIADGCLFEY